MVEYWRKQRERALRIQKYRIQHHEKHGNGKVAMEEKQQLIKMEKKNKELNEK